KQEARLGIAERFLKLFLAIGCGLRRADADSCDPGQEGRRVRSKEEGFVNVRPGGTEKPQILFAEAAEDHDAPPSVRTMWLNASSERPMQIRSCEESLRSSSVSRFSSASCRTASDRLGVTIWSSLSRIRCRIQPRLKMGKCPPRARSHADAD